MPDEESGVNESETISKLHIALDELRRRNAHEDDREKTANSKLSSSLVALPIIISLSTTAFFTLLTYAVRFSWFGGVIVSLFIAAIVCFFIASIIAISGLWPRSARYSAASLKVIVQTPKDHSQIEYMRRLLAELSDVVRANGIINARKLGQYADSSVWMVVGLGLLVLIVVLFAVIGFVMPSKLLAPLPSPAPAATITCPHYKRGHCATRPAVMPSSHNR